MTRSDCRYYLCSGGDSTSFYVRTSEDNIYGWGRNNVGQLGDTTTIIKIQTC